MNKHYTVISFNFNGYDKLREPLFCDPNAEYIYITDHKVKSKNWKVIIDPKLVNKNPIYSSYYVRYHPFEYANTNIVIVVDASVQIKDSLKDIVNEFEKYNSDIAPMCTNYPNDENKIKQWLNERKALITEDADKIKQFIKYTKQEEFKGAIGTAFTIYRNTKAVRRFQKHVWRYLLATGSYGVPNRMDEIVFHKILKFYARAIRLFVTSIQILQSTYMDYCMHKFDALVNKYNNYDQYYYLFNVPVKPFRFDKDINFPETYKYKTDAILLTKYLNEKDLTECLDHHINYCKFEHIQVFDNESKYDVKSICEKYPNVDYELVEGEARQYKIYNDYIENHCKAKWVMPIDDDEYLTFSDEFKSVYEAICYYENKFPHMNMLAVRWKHLFPKKFHTERTGKVLDYCTEENPELAKTFMHLGDGTVKTIVKRYGKIHYEETCENPAGGHVPKNSTFYGALLSNGQSVTGCGILEAPKELEDEKIRLIHCRYKGYTEYKEKIKDVITISDKNHHKKNWKFNELLDTLE